MMLAVLVEDSEIFSLISTMPLFKLIRIPVSLVNISPVKFILLVEDAANALIGSSLDDKALDRLAAAASAACNPISDKRGTVEFRTQVAGVLAKRTAKIAYARAQGENT